MAQLGQNWFVEGLQDFEYKKYLLLAYLQWVRARFDEQELYPAFSDLIHHYENLKRFRESRAQLWEAFPKKLTGLDTEKLRLLYERMAQDDETLREVDEIVDFSLPRLRTKVEDGRGLYELIDENILIEAIGLLPLYKSEGYFLLQVENDSEIRAYAYHLTVFERANERFRGIHTQAVGTFTYSLTNSFEAIKLELIRTHKTLPNPATFYISSKLRFPEHESIVPVAKRKFMVHLARLDG